MPKFSGGIPPLLKKLVILLELRDMLEQLDAHPKTATKIARWICWILHKIAPHQLVVVFYPFPPQLLSIENGTTNFSAAVSPEKRRTEKSVMEGMRAEVSAWRLAFRARPLGLPRAGADAPNMPR
jgi:hypothetical protein